MFARERLAAKIDLPEARIQVLSCCAIMTIIFTITVLISFFLASQSTGQPLFMIGYLSVSSFRKITAAGACFYTLLCYAASQLSISTALSYMGEVLVSSFTSLKRCIFRCGFLTEGPSGEGKRS